MVAGRVGRDGHHLPAQGGALAHGVSAAGQMSLARNRPEGTSASGPSIGSVCTVSMTALPGITKLPPPLHTKRHGMSVRGADGVATTRR